MTMAELADWQERQLVLWERGLDCSHCEAFDDGECKHGFPLCPPLICICYESDGTWEPPENAPPIRRLRRIKDANKERSQ